MASDFSERTALLSDPYGRLLSYGPPNFARSWLKSPETAKFRRSKLPLAILGVGLLLGAFTQSFDLAYLLTNYNRRIASDLNNLANSAWIVLAGSISDSASQPLYSHVALSRGIETPILAAVWLCAQGLLFCSLSSNFWQLVLSRIVVGLGSSGLDFLTVITINELVTVTELPLWRSVVLIVRTAADMTGGPAGSAIADRMGWRFTFDLEYLSMFLACIGVTISVALSKCARIQLLPSSPSPSSSSSSSSSSSTAQNPHVGRRFDALGALCLVVAVVAPLFAISIGGEILPWSHPLEISMIALSPVFLAVFFWVESRAKSPIIPTKLLANRDALKVFAAAAGVVFAYNSVVFNLSLYIDLQTSAFIQDSGLTFVFAARPVGAILSGIVIKRTGRFKALFVINLFIFAGLYAMLALTSRDTGVSVYILLLISIGFMMGISESCLFVGLFSIVDKEEQSPLYATFSLILAFVADIAIAVSSAFMRTLLRLRLYEELGRSEATDEIIRRSLQSLNYVRSLPHDLRRVVFDALAYSIRFDYFLASCLIGLSIFAALGMRDTRR